MIIYDLSCNKEHRFEGWFASSEAFDQQVLTKQLNCPVCGSYNIRRIPSAPHLSSECSAQNQPNPQQTPLTPAPLTTEINLDQAVSLYRQAVQFLLQSSEDVGARFAEEARKIHQEEVPYKSIHGQATKDDVEQLRDEGIDVLQILAPKRREDLN